MLHMLATLAEHERELVVERGNAGIVAERESGTRFECSPVNPDTSAEKLAIVADARGRGRTAAEAAALVGWSHATLYSPGSIRPALSPGAGDGAGGDPAGVRACECDL
jgi:DNA invertase Pin-like site-specific DNA recombinase